jgi:AcrR family transcriptional regulator
MTGLATSGRREATKAANRAAILAAGRDVFAELGYGAASVRDIVRRTELAAGTFYNYFPDKEAVFRALVHEVGAEARRRVRAARHAAVTPRGFVEDAYRAYFSFIVEDAARAAFLTRNASAIRVMFEQSEAPAGIDELAADLRAAIAAGIVPVLDIEYMAAAMVGAALEVGVEMVRREPPDVDGATRFATTVLLGGIERLGRGAGDGVLRLAEPA